MPATRDVISSSWVGERRNPESLRSLMRSSSEFAEYRPDCFHNVSVVMDDIESFDAPIDRICLSIKASSLLCTRRPSGRR
jgi:hypothetical protein